MPQLITSPSGVRGFDCNATIDADAAAAFAAAGYSFAVRYVRRREKHAADLSAEEITTLHGAGLAVMAVQHVKSETSWEPTRELGREYGVAASLALTELGMPAGAMCWLDLEGVAQDVDAAIVDAYCRAWHGVVKGAGYLPGLYVGWRAGLDAEELYALPFRHYWAAYNLNADEYPAERGVQMKQHEARAGDVPEGVSIDIDVDTINVDRLGGLPVLYAPDGWQPT